MLLEKKEKVRLCVSLIFGKGVQKTMAYCLNCPDKFHKIYIEEKKFRSLKPI